MQLHALLLAADVPTPPSDRNYPVDPKMSDAKRWVANGTRTRNSQNHNLGLYH